MSQTKAGVHKLTIRNRPEAEGRISVGANTQVFLDGEKLKGVTFVKFEVKATKVTRVTIELYAELDVEAYVFLEEGKKTKTGLKKAGSDKFLAKYELSNPAPAAIVERTEE